MKKIYQFITRATIAFALYGFMASSPAFGQALTVEIIYGEDPTSLIEVCQGSLVLWSVEVQGGTGDNQIFTWSGDINPLYFIDLGEGGGYKATTPAGTYNLTVDVEDDGPFYGSANLTVIIKPSPSATIVANGPTTFCQGGSVELEETTSQSDVVYQWQRNFTNIIGANSQTYDATQTGNFRVVVTNTTSGCSKNSSQIAVTVNPLPAATAGNDGPYCYGETINLTSGPGGMVSYDWTSDATTPFTSSLQDPTIASANPDNSGTYTVTVEDGNGCVNTAQTTVLVYEALDAGSIGDDQEICYGGDPEEIDNVTAPSGGDETWTYQWQSRVGANPWQFIAGAVDITYTPPSGLTQTTSYRRRGVSSLCGNTNWTNIVTVTVYPEEVAGSISNPQVNLCYGEDLLAFTSETAPSGGNPGGWTYQWERKEDGGSWEDIPGATGAAYNPGSPFPMYVNTEYRRREINACKTLYSNVVSINVYDQMFGGTIKAQDDQPICYGDTPTTITEVAPATGGHGAWSYKWYSSTNGVDWALIAGETGNEYTPSAPIYVTTYYRRLVTNSCGDEYSNIVTVAVLEQLDPGTIDYTETLPICYNTIPGTISSTAPATGGDDTFTYEWQWSTNLVDWNFIAGADGLTYTPSSALTQTTSYRRRGHSLQCGYTGWSNVITVTVYPEEVEGSISNPHINLCYGEDLSAFTSVTLPLGGHAGGWTYQWERKEDGGSWEDIPGATAAAYDPGTPFPLYITTEYRRREINTCKTLYSNVVAINVYDQMFGGTIKAQDDQPICYGDTPTTITEVVPATGGHGVWSYKWYSSTNGVDWALIAGETGNEYTPSAPIFVTTHYRRLVTNSCGDEYSNTVTVGVLAQLDPGSISYSGVVPICYNTTPGTINSTAPATGGDNNFTYQWQWSTNLVDWNNIVGANGASYTPTDPITVETYFRRMATSTQCGPVFSAHVTISVHDEIDGGSITGDQTICYGEAPYSGFLNAVLPSGGSNAFSYKWQYSENLSDWTDILVNNSSYTHLGNLYTTTHFRRVATDAQCPVPEGISNIITVTVHPEFLPGTIAIATTEVCHGQSPGTINEVDAATGGVGATTYKWFRNEGLGWAEIVGETGTTYDVPNLTQTTTYRRWAENTCGNGFSNEITITVNPLPTQFNVTGGGEYCEGSTGVAVGLSGSQTGVTYTLILDGSTTGTTASGTGSAISFGLQTAEGTYTVSAENNTTGCQNMMSGSVDVTEIPTIDDNIIDDDQTICSGSIPAGLTGQIPTGGNGAGTYSYQWYNSTNGTTFNIIAGATGQNYDPPALNQTTWYQREVISGPCSSLSNTIEITVNQPIGNNTIADNQSICYNTAPDELVGSMPTNGGGSYAYQWQYSTAGAGGPYANIAGAESQNYQPGDLTQDTWFRRVVSSPPCGDNESAPVLIAVSPELTITGFSTINPTCSDSSDGEAEVNHSGGTAPYFYSWSPSGQTTKRAVGLSAGIEYAVTVTDNIGCPASGVNTITLTAPDPIDIDYYTVTSIIDAGGCHGDAIGSIEVLANGGTPNYVYSLYRGAILVGTLTPVHPSPAIFSGLIADNNYRIEITDAHGCTPAAESDIALIQPDQLVVDNVAITDAICYGEDNGTITITASGGTPPYSYSIDGDGGPFAPNNVFMVGEGSYEIWVMDDHGCLASYAGNSVYVGEPDEIFVGFNEVLPVTGCHGNTNGVIDIKPHPLPYDDYQFTITQFPDESDWVEEHRFEGLAAGIYYPKVRHKATGCIAEYVGTSVEIGQPQIIDFTIDNIVHVTGCWYNTNGRFRARTPSGGYGTKQVSIDGSIWYSFPHTFTNLGVGTYTVYAKDENDCIVTKQVDITGPPPIVISDISLINNPLLCYGDSNAEIHVTASGGTGSLTYYINGGMPNVTGSWTGLTQGDYLIEIFDSNNCVLDTTVTIESPDELEVETQVIDILCSHSGDAGVIRARGIGGTAPYTITLYKGGIQEAQFTGVNENEWRDFTGLAVGNDYEVEVDDANFCGPVASGMLEVNVPDPLTIDAPVITHPVCNGVPDGDVSVTANGGTPPYTYTLYDELNAVVEVLTSNAGVLFTNVAAGDNYYITVDDDHLCGPVATAPFDVIEPAAIVIDPLSITITHITCNGYDDGAISLTATGGTGNLYYTLLQGGVPVAGPQTNNGTFAPLTPGIYEVSVTDDEGCGPVLSGDLEVEEPEPIELSLNVVDLACPGDKGYIAVSADEGTAPYTIALQQDGVGIGSYAGINANVAVEFDNLDVGVPAYVYVVVVTDSRGCTVNSYDITFTEPAPITIINQSFTTIQCNGDNEGSITVEAVGGTGVITYTLYESVAGYVDSNIDGIFTNLPSGIYTVDITDGNLCPGPTAGPFDLTEPDAIQFDVGVSGLTCFGDVTITVTNVTGGVGSYEYSFDGNPFTSSNVYTFTPTDGGVSIDIEIIVRDDNLCEVSHTETISIPAELNLNLSIVQNPLCIGDDNGIIFASASGGVLPYIYQIDGAGPWITTGTFEGLMAGTHSVVVLDGAGCTATNSVELEDPDPIVISSINFDSPSCDPDGSSAFGHITVEAIGGTGSFNFVLFRNTLYFDENTTGVFNGLSSGEYYVEVYDSNGCGPTTSGIITLDNPTDIEFVSFNLTHVDCHGDNSGAIEVTVTNALGTPMFSLIPGYETWQTDNVFTGLLAGIYTVRAKDDNNCIIAQDVTINEPAMLTLTVSGTPPSTALDTDGYIDVTVAGGTPNYWYALYIWDDGTGNWLPIANLDDTSSTNHTFSDLGVGLYRVTITDNNNCSTSEDILLTMFNISLTGSDALCYGSCDGTITVNSFGGTIASITWTLNGDDYTDEMADVHYDAVNDIYINLCAGVYEALATDTDGNVATASVTIGEPSLLTIPSGSYYHSPNCNNGTDGEIYVEPQGGTPPYTITLTVNGNAVIESGFGLYEGLDSGIYYLLIEDANGCQYEDVITLINPEPISYNLNFSYSTVNEIEINVTPVSSTFSYDLYLERGADTQFVENSTSGIFSNLNELEDGWYYYIQVTDQNGCTKETMRFRKFTPHPVACYGDTTGYMSLMFYGGLLPYDIDLYWVEGDEFIEEGWGIHEDYANLSAGNYNVTVIDAEGNSISQTVVITQPDAISVDVISVTDPMCNGENTGYVVLGFTGGTPFTDADKPYFLVSWDGNPAGTAVADTLFNIGAGSHLFTITDANGCSYTMEQEVVITDPEGMSLASLFVYDLLCYNDGKGEITMWAEGGTEPISYTIHGPDGLILTNNNGIFSNLAAGSYDLFITDAMGCSFSFPEGNKVVIKEPEPLIISTVQPVDALECHYNTIPEVALQVEGGTPNYTYLWSNGQQTLNLINATPDEYTITVMDANGCVASLLIDIPGPRKPDYLKNITEANCRVAPGGDVGAIQIYDVVGGNGVFSADYDVRWYYQAFNEPLPNLNGHWTINDLKSGKYIARISYPTFTNPNASCWDTTEIIVPFNEANSFTLGIEKEKDIFCWGESAHLSATVIEGNIGTNPTYRWYNVTDDPNNYVSTSDTYITDPLDEDKIIDLVVLSTLGCRENRRDTLFTYPQIGPYLPRELHNFFSEADLINFGDSTVISVLADTDYPVEVYTLSSGIGLTYSWDPAIFFEPSNSSVPVMLFATGVYESYLQDGPTIHNPNTNKDEKYIPITGIVRSEYGCREDIRLKARILNRIVSSNVFTPNDDGINDRWTIPYADLFENLEIKIFNRWGALVWTAKGTEAAKGWDGKSKNGKDLPVGTYYYVINFNVEGTSKWKPIKGSVTIVK
ncbi:MAG: gliding motility-associated C-terminal domain-containing protein [Bacteroidales bacterium]|nr:gliding motility-associated C-terminal domain-containing protein [Bacteroidales bacterium]